MKKLIFAGFLVMLLGMAGCTSPANQNELNDTPFGQDTGQETTQDNVTTLPQDAPVTTLSAELPVTTIAEATGSTDTKPAAGADLKAQLKGLFSNAALEYTVAYDTTMSGAGQPEYKAQMAYYIKGQNKMRIDTLADMPGAGESRFYMIDGSFIMCNKQAGTWNCIKMPQQDSSQDPKKQAEDIQNNIDMSAITQLPDRIIAGVTAKCYKMVVTVSTQEAKNSGMSTWDNTYCLSPEGVLLYSDSNNQNMHVIQEATSYKTSVADSDLVPPAEPKSLVSGVPGMQSGQPTGYTLPDGVTMPEMPSRN